jgi:polysaccharide deacetylase family protein (PEP-CTERM system associated)
MAGYTFTAERTGSGSSAVSQSKLCGPYDGLSVDVEDYFQVEAFADVVSPSSWDRFTRRVCRNTERVLELLAKYHCRATFFVLGWVADREPALLRTIAAAGHEIACHGYSHQRLISLTPGEFREDVQRAVRAIENATGMRPLGYRAPTFSIMRDTLWALEILAEQGFCYDSSIYPIRHDLYGYPEFPRFPQIVRLGSAKTIIEIPMSTARLFGINLPCGGGGYLRHLPMAYTRWALERIHRSDRRPAVLYFHPWEIDPEQPRLKGRWKSRLRHYRGLKGFERRLAQLLATGNFQPLIELARQLPNLSSPTYTAAAS